MMHIAKSHYGPIAVGIAGCEGYVGARMTQAALELGCHVYGYDTAGMNKFIGHRGFFPCSSPEQLIGADTLVTYLALQPKHRKQYLEQLLSARKNVLCEKPMSSADAPEECLAINKLVERTMERLCIISHLF
jgi:predicted dehydrogenase